MKNEWITSSDVRCTTTGRSTGTCSWLRSVKSSSVSNRPSGPGYVTFHSNCFASTRSSNASAGNRSGFLMSDQSRWLMKASATMITAGVTVQTTSAGVFPSM